jgi:hypothetical protein
MKQVTIDTAITALLFYLIGAFISLKWNVIEWDPYSRFVLVVFTMGAVCMAFVYRLKDRL